MTSESYTEIKMLGTKVPPLVVVGSYEDVSSRFDELGATYSGSYIPARVEVATGWTKSPGIPTYNMNNANTEPCTVNLALVKTVCPATVR